MSYKSVPQECPTRVSRKSVLQECPKTVLRKSFLQEWPARAQECPTRVSQECPTRVSCKSAPQECPTRVTHKSFLSLQEYPTRVPRKSVLQECHLGIWNVFAFGFVDSECVAKGSRLTLGGLGVEPCSRPVASMFATVRNRPQPFATVRSRTLRRCHWGKLLQVTFHGCVTCQFATLFHCDLHENDMSRKKRDAFRCTGAVV